MNELIINKQTLHRETAEFNEHYKDMNERLNGNKSIISKIILLQIMQFPKMHYY